MRTTISTIKNFFFGAIARMGRKTMDLSIVIPARIHFTIQAEKSKMETILLILCFPLVIMAMPSISSIFGTLTNGSTITISGTGFLSHADYHDTNQTGQINWAWQSWRDNVLELNGFTCSVNPPSNAYWLMSNSGTRIPGTSFARRNNTSGGDININGEQRIDQYQLSKRTGRYFVSYYQRFNSTYGGASGKITRYASSSNFGVGDFWPATENGDVMGSNDIQKCWSGAASYTVNVWQRIELLMDANTNSQQIWVVGVNGNEGLWTTSPCGSMLIDNIATSNTGNLDANIGASANNGGMLDLCDVYIDFTQARIEMGNASTWLACTHREIQIPKAWSTTSITATVNIGSFGASDSVYLFVVDSLNSPSAGFHIKLGSGSSGVKLKWQRKAFPGKLAGKVFDCQGRMMPANRPITHGLYLVKDTDNGSSIIASLVW